LSPKQDGGWKTCIDSRAINKITIKYIHFQIYFVKEICKSKRIFPLLDGDLVNGSRVYTRFPSSILLWTQYSWYCTWTQALSDQSFIQKFVYLTPDFFILCQSHPVSFFIWQTCSRDQIYVMTNASNKW
jgi:hypothetical protein